MPGARGAAPVGHFLNAIAAGRAGRDRAAESEYRTVVEALPGCAAAWRGLAVAQHRLGRTAAADGSIRKARVLEAGAIASVVATLMFHRDDRRAHRLLARAVATNPDCLKAY
ncbi:MAG: hypothetical protein FJX53_04295 [Alphaproteobacteria bacterium]|nr:hypothetical protein [Alphaproteobacteria bacterium]